MQTQTITLINPSIETIRNKILEADNTIGSVHFIKRKSGELRKMSYRLHVVKPSTAKVSKTLKQKMFYECFCKNCEKAKIAGFTPFDTNIEKINKKDIDKKNNLITVLDCNKIVKDKNGKIKGRGDWRSISLEGVVKITNKGKTYMIKRN